MSQHVFKIKRVSDSQELLHYTAWVDEFHAVFDGHFPHNPVIPGVCTLEMLKQCLGDALERPLRYEYIRECKFLAPILPAEHKQLEVMMGVKEEEGMFHVTAVVTAVITTGVVKMLKMKAVLKDNSGL